MDPSTDIRPSREPRKSKRIQEATSNYNSGMLMRTRGVEGWYIDGDAVNYGFALSNTCPLDILLKDPVVRNGMSEVHWDWAYWAHDGSGIGSNDRGLTLKYKRPPKNKPIVPTSVTGSVDYNGFRGKIVSLESREKRQGGQVRRNWYMNIVWASEDEDLGVDPTLELGVAEDSNGYPYIYVGFNLEEYACHGVFPLNLVGKRNTGVLTSQERLNLGLLIPGRTFLQHMSVKHGRMFEYDPEFDELDWRMTNKEDSGDEAQGENMLSVKVEDSPRRVRQSSNKSSQIIRTQGVESWFIDETRIRYGFVLQDAPSLTELLKNAKGGAQWSWVYARTDHTIIDGKELDGLTLDFDTPEDGQEVNPETVTSRIEYDGLGGNIEKITPGRGLHGQRTWNLHIDWWSDMCKLGSTAIEVGVIKDENGYPFIYLGFNLDQWCPLHLIGKRTINPKDETLTKQERKGLGLKMSVKQFVRYASKRTGKTYEYDSDLDDVVSLYDNENNEKGEADVKMEEVDDIDLTLRKRKAEDVDEPQPSGSSKKMRK